MILFWHFSVGDLLAKVIWFSALVPCFTCISLSNLIAHKLLHKSHYTHRQSHTHTHTPHHLSLSHLRPFPVAEGVKGVGSRVTTFPVSISRLFAAFALWGRNVRSVTLFWPSARWHWLLYPSPLYPSYSLFLCLSVPLYSLLFFTMRNVSQLLPPRCVRLPCGLFAGHETKVQPNPFPPLTTPPALPFALWDRLPSLRRVVECCNQVLARK